MSRRILVAAPEESKPAETEPTIPTTSECIRAFCLGCSGGNVKGCSQTACQLHQYRRGKWRGKRRGKGRPDFAFNGIWRFCIRCAGDVRAVLVCPKEDCALWPRRHDSVNKGEQKGADHD